MAALCTLAPGRERGNGGCRSDGHVATAASIAWSRRAVACASAGYRNGLRFRVEPGQGHKTGFFADQRDNRRRLADFCRDKRVLDLCCNSGGFAVYAKVLGQLDMNKLALSVLKPGGVLLTCSCTGLVSEEQFLDMLRRAAFYSGRSVQVLEVRGAGADHPWLAQVPESRYLKAVFCRVV